MGIISKFHEYLKYIMLTESYIIHSQKLNNLNTIVYLLTKDFGFIQAFYNKKNYNNTTYKYSKQSILQPFNSFLVNLNNKKNQIISIEENFVYINKNNSNNKAYFYKSYITELIFLFYKNYNNDPNSIIFQSYQKSLKKMDHAENINNLKIAQHHFENSLLKDLGFEVNFLETLNSENDLYYQYNIKNNIFTHIEINKDNLANLDINTDKITLRCLINNLIFPKNIILNLKKNIYNNNINLYAGKILNYQIIQYYLNYKTVYSYEHIS